MEAPPRFDARLKEGVAYFEQMLKVMPDDRTTLEFLTVAYPQLGDEAKAEWALVELVRVLLKEGDLEKAGALLPRLEAAGDAAKTMAVRVRAASAPRPELVPETAAPPLPARTTSFEAAAEAEAALAERLGEPEIATALRALPDNGRLNLVSALATLEKERPEVCERALARLADETGDVPIPLDAFDLDRQLIAQLPAELMRRRGVIPFARLGKTALVVTLSPHDAVLRREICDIFGKSTRFYLTEPRHVEAALAKLFPEEEPKN